MKTLCVLLAAAIIQGAIGQQNIQDLFSVEPNAQNVVTAGQKVVLECVTREESTCAWKLAVPGVGAQGFLNNRPASGFTVRSPDSGTDCTVTIDNVDARYSGTYTCSPYFDNRGSIDGTPAEIIVAEKPESVEFTGDLLGAAELIASSSEPTSITCQARNARPKAELRWFLEDSELTEGVEKDEVTDPDSKLVTSRSTLTHQFEKQDDGRTLRCEASHPAYTPDDENEASLSVMVQFAPFRAEGSDLGTLYGFAEDEDRDVTVNFTANPAPDTIQWMVGQDLRLANGEQADGGRLVAGPLETVDAATHQYAVRLSFRPVKAADRNTTFSLLLGNSQGRQELSLRVGADAPPPPPIETPQPASSEGNDGETGGPAGGSEDSVDNAGVSGGAIGGIIVAVILLLAIIALLAFARSRGKWCFAAKPSDAGAEALVTKKKEGDVESAVNKEETKELTAPDGEGSPKREQPEVVYAELVLDKDGVKTEVRPSPEKTEYAVIVGTKTPEAKE